MSSTRTPTGRRTVATAFIVTVALAGVSALAPEPPDASVQDTVPLPDCVSSLRQELPAHPQVTAQTFDLYTATAQDLRPLIDSSTRTQPEFQLAIWDYLARLADAERAARGRQMMQREAKALAAIEQRHGVDAAITVSVFGVETDYGRVAGRYPVVDATLSRACLNLKSAERKRHFFAALWLLQEGAVKPEQFKGSWAGAFGMTQFMPATFVSYMSDGGGAPPADIINSVPDALATTARYLRGLGWQPGLSWGVEVRVPAALMSANALEAEHGCLAQPMPTGACRRAAQWAAAGVTRVDGSPLLGDGPGGRLDPSANTALLMPAVPQGPAWIVTPNYHALWRYNRADAYALAIGLLSNSLRGAPPQRTAWPTDDPPLSRSELRELQTMLVARGHCAVQVDGAPGPTTSEAVRAEEGRLGWMATGRPGAKLLQALRAAGSGGAQDCALTAAASRMPAALSSAASEAAPPASGARPAPPPHAQSPGSAPSSPRLSAPPPTPPSDRSSSPS
jgi:glucose-6-phosphate 1-epimerase